MDERAWDRVHLDHTKPPAPSPVRGLRMSETEWSEKLRASPNGHLLTSNSTSTALARGGTIHLMHTTVALDQIIASGRLYASTGCLLAALYCAPLTPVPGGLRPHNLGAYLLATKPWTRTLVLEIDTGTPTPALGIDYLRAGPIHLATYRHHRDALTGAEDTALRAAVTAGLRSASRVLEVLLAQAADGSTPAKPLLDHYAAAVDAVPFLGYLYFEVVSEYLMLYSTSAETRDLAELGEVNNRIYKKFAFTAADGMGQLFNPGRVAPGHDRLLELIRAIEPGLETEAAEYVRHRLPHLAAATFLAPGLAADSIGIDPGWDFDGFARVLPGLVGQSVFRATRELDRYPQLYPRLEQAKANSLWAYWNANNLATPFYGLVPKGEIGVNPAYPNAAFSVWTAEVCGRGLLHKVDRLDVTMAPHLADLSMTAMRRDSAGRTTGHPRPTDAVGGVGVLGRPNPEAWPLTDRGADPNAGDQ